MPYETGSYATSESKTCHFARVTDIKAVITTMVNEVIACGSLHTPQNISSDTLNILLQETKAFLNKNPLTTVKFRHRKVAFSLICQINWDL